MHWMVNIEVVVVVVGIAIAISSWISPMAPFAFAPGHVDDDRCIRIEDHIMH